jgi:asparagine synthase (glutamine-hydrolysing)
MRQCAEQVRADLIDSVRAHLMSDVPLGLFLSGGLDSSLLAAGMASLVSDQIQAFNVSFADKDADESPHARLVAHTVGAVSRGVVVTPADFFRELPRLIWHEDEPIAFTSSIPLHVVSRLAREHVKVVLTGEGADELFLGYDYRYRITMRNLQLGAWYERMMPTGLRRGVARSVSGFPQRLKRYAERSFLALDCDPRAMFFENFSVFRSAHRRSLLRQSEPGASQDTHEPYMQFYDAGGADALACMSHADMQTYLVELLMKQDQMSMAASLESRVPFLDHELVERVASIPGRIRMQGGRPKALLRQAVRDIVPEEILNRAKMGFPVPIGNWLRGPFWCWVEELVLGPRARMRGHFNTDQLERLAHEHLTGRADHAERLWLLINLEIWQRIFIDGEDPAAIRAGKSRSVSRGEPGGLSLSPTPLQSVQEITK